MSLDLDLAPNDDKFFTMPLVHNRANVPLPANVCHGHFNANSSSPDVPHDAPTHSYYNYVLSKPNWPSRKAVIEEDDESVLAFRSGNKGTMLDDSASSDGAESDTEDIEIKITLPIRTCAPPSTPVTEVNPFEDAFSAASRRDGEAPSINVALGSIKGSACYFIPPKGQWKRT